MGNNILQTHIFHISTAHYVQILEIQTFATEGHLYLVLNYLFYEVNSPQVVQRPVV